MLDAAAAVGWQPRITLDELIDETALYYRVRDDAREPTRCRSTRVLASSLPESAVVLAPHADDEAMGCSGLMAKLAEAGRAHPRRLPRRRRLPPLRDRRRHDATSSAWTRSTTSWRCSASNCTHEIAYGDQDLIEQLDTLPRRELVDRFEKVLNEHKPELLLIPALPDYDQDHQAVFHAAHAAARPIAAQFGK